MASRTRSIILDNTLSKVYKQVVTPGAATPANVIAGTALKSATLFSLARTATAVKANNLGGRTNGLIFPGTSIIKTFKVAVTSAASGGPITVVFKVGTTYATSVVVYTATLAQSVLTANTEAAILIDPNYNMYVDVTTIGTTRPGSGLSASIDYYSA